MIMSDQFIVVVYDISNDRRRVKLHNLLRDYGTPVQYSVFECYLNPKRASEMKKRVVKLIKQKVDSVRFYTLCEACLKRIEVPGVEDILKETPDAIVV
jgi:CRISPR-associated protein Cas2